MISFEEFKAQFGKDPVADLVAMARSDLEMDVPEGLKKADLLKAMHAALEAKETGAEAPAVPEPEPAPAGETVDVVCSRPRGMYRSGRKWEHGHNPVPVGELSPEVLAVLKADPSFRVIE